jgi:hypothetical protein
MAKDLSCKRCSLDKTGKGCPEFPHCEDCKQATELAYEARIEDVGEWRAKRVPKYCPEHRDIHASSMHQASTKHNPSIKQAMPKNGLAVAVAIAVPEVAGGLAGISEADQLCEHLRVLFNQQFATPSWKGSAEECIKQSGLGECKAILSWAMKVPFWIKQISGMESFLKLLMSSSERGLAGQYFAWKRSQKKDTSDSVERQPKFKGKRIA